MTKAVLGIIGGSGLYDLPGIEGGIVRHRTVADRGRGHHDQGAIMRTRRRAGAVEFSRAGN